MNRKYAKPVNSANAGEAADGGRWPWFLSRPITHAREQFKTNWEYLDAVKMPVAMLGAILFPTYYVIWVYVFPQPYENLPLRLIGSAGCLFLALRSYWPRSFLRYELLFWYLVILYCVPFIFTYLLFKSGTTQVATMTLMVLTFVLILMVDWLNLIIISALGAFLGWLLYVITDQQLLPSDFDLEFLAVWLFIVVFGSAANYRSELVIRERMRAMLMAAGNIAHEMRTPLLAIKANATAQERYLPKLIEAYRLARESGVDVERIRRGQLNELSSTAQRISAEADQANVVIDMLLNNAGRIDIQPEEFRRCAINDCVDQALARYVFKSEVERDAIDWNKSDGFEFDGSEHMVIHVLFNLLKNALYFVQRNGEGRIWIEARTEPEANWLIFRDDGPGIAPELLPKIFEPFISSLDRGVGTGLGLAYCRMVMRGLGGDITCRSELDQFTEFRLRFPKV